MENLGPEYTDIMVDIETTGTMPDRAGILQIAAVKFNLEKGTVCPITYSASLTLPGHRFWSVDTSNWWQRQKAGILKKIVSQQRDYREVMLEFAKWSYQTPGLRFWAKPTTFDFMFLASYFADENLINPFHYREAKDMNTFLYGLHFPNPVPDIPWDNTVGDAHDALNDCWMQLKHLFAHVEYAKNPPLEIIDVEASN